MKQSLIFLYMSIFISIVIVIVVFIISFIYYVSTYNKTVKLEENVKAIWSQVLSQYERRADLIPNLVSVVKGYANHESELLADIVDKRAKVGQIKLTVDDLNNNSKIKSFQQAQDELGKSLSRLLFISENYPDLKANENFLTLQSQIEGTENRISVARKDYIESILKYNSSIKSIPAKWILGDKFKPYPEYNIEESKKDVPNIEFK